MTDGPTPLEDREPIRLHYNPPQLKFALVRANVSVCIWGRRTGKTEGPMADFTLDNIHSMPRSNGIIGGTTYEQLLTRTLPPLVAAWERRGYLQGTHYWVKKFPPSQLRVPKAYRTPLEPTHYIQWYNGSGIFLVSQDRPGTSNGVSSQWQAWDEAKFLKPDKLKEEALLTLSGCAEHFGHLSNYLSLLFCSDMPTNSRGRWLLDFEQQMDPKAIELILALAVQAEKIKQKIAETQSKARATILGRELKEVEEALTQLRSDCVYFSRATTIDNIHALGLAPIKQFKRTLNPAVFDSSVMNRDVVMAERGFYALLDEDRHGYDAPNNELLDRLEVSAWSKFEKNSLYDTDVQRDEPLHIACDYNAAINCVAIGQPAGKVFRVLNALYVKHPEMLGALVARFVEYYKHHRNKTVYYYYDHTAVAKSASTSISYAQEWISELQKAGWHVIGKHIGQTPAQHARYLFWQISFREQKPTIQRFRYNRANCHWMIIAMQQTETKSQSGLTAKDKDTEKDVTFPQEEAPHITDALDTLWWATQRHRLNQTPGTAGDYDNAY